MKYTFSYYNEDDFLELENLILASYTWEYPVWGLSRHEFCKGLHPAFLDHYHAWEHTVGVYRLDGRIAACVIHEGNYSGEAFFLFDSKERGSDEELLGEMVRFAKTHCSLVSDDRIKRSLTLFVPEWNKKLKEMLPAAGCTPSDRKDELYILDFKEKQYDTTLPQGYTFADGNTVPDFFLSNTHRFSFAYGGDVHACEYGRQAFHDLRQMRHYRKDLDLCVLDPLKRPVAMAIIWYNEAMPYCELEPLGVVWWERRKGIATAILHEAANRVMDMFPGCTGMTGGDQKFYREIGYELKDSPCAYHWEMNIHPSWNTESLNEKYSEIM